MRAGFLLLVAASAAAAPLRADLRMVSGRVRDITRPLFVLDSAARPQTFSVASESGATRHFRVLPQPDCQAVVGESVNDDGATAVLVQRDGAQHVLVREPGKPLLHAHRIADGTHAVRRVSQAVFPDESEPEGTYSLRRNYDCPATESHSVVRVGVFHTKEAAEEAGGSAFVMMDVRAALAEANALVLPQSGLNISLELCANGRIDIDEGTRPGNTLDNFVRHGGVDVIRTAAKCDAVVLYASTAALGWRSCGIGQLPGTHSVVAGPCFKDNLSFLHELGHNLNACHLGCGNGRSAYANTAQNFRTIMAYASTCNNCPRIPRFSNSLPAFSWNGHAIGDAEHDNTRVMNAWRGILEGRVC
jgi:hypothetical protein